MTNNRPIKKLGEIVKITKGKKVNYFSDKKKYNYIDIGILRSNKVVEFTDDDGVSCKKEDILIAWDGSKSGTVGYGLEGIIGSTLARLEIIEKKIYTPYIGEFLKGQFDFLNKNTSGAAIPHIRKEVLVGLEIPLPPLDIQKAIVAKLDEAFAEIDEAIATTQANIEKMNEFTKSVLDKVFEEGDWEKKSVKEITSILGDGLHGTPKYDEKGDYYFINGNNLDNGKITFKTDTKRVSIGEYEKYKKILNNRTIFVSINGTIGNVAFYNNEKIILGKSACYFNLIEGINKFFIKYAFMSNYFLNYANEELTGTTIKNVSLKTMRNFKIPLPPLAKQTEIVKYLDEVFAETSELKSQYQNKLNELKELKASILQSAFEGKLV